MGIYVAKILNIEKNGKDKTIIVSAHRESSIDLCDRRIYLNTREVTSV